jgi:hypothetical protein
LLWRPQQQWPKAPEVLAEPVELGPVPVPAAPELAVRVLAALEQLELALAGMARQVAAVAILRWISECRDRRGQELRSSQKAASK